MTQNDTPVETVMSLSKLERPQTPEKAKNAKLGALDSQADTGVDAFINVQERQVFTHG